MAFRIKRRGKLAIFAGVLFMFCLFNFTCVRLLNIYSFHTPAAQEEFAFGIDEASRTRRLIHPFVDLQRHRTLPENLKPNTSSSGKFDGGIKPRLKNISVGGRKDYQTVQNPGFVSHPELSDHHKQMLQENRTSGHDAYNGSSKHQDTEVHNVHAGGGPKELIEKDPQREQPITAPKNDAEKKDFVEVDKNQTYGAVTFPDFVEYGKPGDPGENGTEFVFGANDLTEEEKKKKKEDFKIHYFDEWISKKIAVHRHLPDFRETACKNEVYPSLPAASILIVFYNEAWTTLLRSIHSILDRTPDHLLKEIIILDDFSDLDHLKEPLEIYLKPYKKIRLLRAKERLGLIRARNLVFEQARGDVVIFLDSHIECFPGWIEPLLEPIYFNNTTVTFPTIETIKVHTFAVEMRKQPTNVGGLMLNRLLFNWLYERTKEAKNSDYKRPSPTMPGGLYAISRDFFHHLGQYDPGMDYWGTENLEISFKVWMCGGSILLISCSRVGHIYRTTNPTIPSTNIGFKNEVRVAEVWMDTYKHFFYEKILYNIPDFGNVSSRVELRKSLKCRDFSWYLNVVYPELKKTIDENSVYVGQVKNDATKTCIERRDKGQLSLMNCHESMKQTQFWNLGTDGSIVSQNNFIGVRTSKTNDSKSVGNVEVFHKLNSTTDVTWVHDGTRRLVHKNTNLCLQAVPVSGQVLLKECSSSPEQRWNITTRKELQAMYRSKGVPIDWSV